MKSASKNGTEFSGNGLTNKVRHLARRMNVTEVVAALERRYPPDAIRRIYWRVCEDKNENRRL